MRVFGADEAGRGPVLGPMVAAAVRADPDDLPRDVADSKTLTAAKRTALAAEMKGNDRIGVASSIVSPGRIDDSATDMNTLTVVAQADAIAGVFNPDSDPDSGSESDGGGGVGTATDDRDESDETVHPTGIVDACDVDPERFARRLRDALPLSVDLRAEHRADESYRIVAAASVVAKTERDALMADVGEKYQAYGPVGSGYPSDPRTRKFLCEYVRVNDALPACARASWKTSRDVLDAASQSALGDF